MARVAEIGFELQTATAGFEFSSAGIFGNANEGIDTSLKRSGNASLRLIPSADFSWFGHVFKTGGTSATEAFIRAYIYIRTLPSSGECEVIGAWASGIATRVAHIRLTSGGVLQLYAGATQIGSDSAALNTNQWYMIELDVSGGTGTAICEGRLDGVQFASSTTATVSNFDACYFGAPNATSTFDLNWDDIAVNDTSGSAQTSYPGQGKLVLALPTGAGDSAATTGNASMINEIPPSNTATSGVTMIELDTNPKNGEYAMTDSSTLGIAANDAISCLSVLARMREESSGATNYMLRLKSASGGTTSVSSSVDTGDATPRTNPSGTTAYANRLVSYLDPTTGIAWTPTGTNSIDNMQAGVGTTDGNPDTWCLWLGVYVEYVPANTIPNKIVQVKQAVSRGSYF